MGYGMVFRGTYEYASVEAAEHAVTEARANVQFEPGELDADLGEMVNTSFDEIVVRSGASVRVEVDEYGPPGLYPIYETIVETLADAAETGMVVSRMEGEEVEYAAGFEDSTDPKM
jgi:hypothetical protein